MPIRLTLCFSLLLASCAFAQQPQPLAKHPGDVIKYQIVFDGPNADKIKTVFARMSCDGPIQKDQAGFTGQFNTVGQVPPSSAKTFTVEMKIPDNAASGEWRLNFDAMAAEGSANYQDGQEFTVPSVHIENPNKFTPPGVKVTPLP